NDAALHIDIREAEIDICPCENAVAIPGDDSIGHRSPRIVTRVETRAVFAQAGIRDGQAGDSRWLATGRRSHPRIRGKDRLAVVADCGVLDPDAWVRGIGRSHHPDAPIS